MFDLKHSPFRSTRRRLDDLLCAFALLKCRNYAHGLLLQVSLFEYWEHNKHPAMNVLKNHPEILCGDNIEICNGLLGQHSASNSRRTDFRLLNPAYTSLGVLLRHGMAMQEDLEKNISLNKRSTRYTFKKNDECKLLRNSSILS